MFINLKKAFLPLYLKLLLVAIVTFAALFFIIDIANHTTILYNNPIGFELLLTGVLFTACVLFSLVVNKITKSNDNKRIKLKLTQICDSLEEEVSMFNAKNLEFTYLNASFLNNSQYEKNELLNQPIIKTNPDCDKEQMKELIKSLENGSITELAYETTRIRKDGSKYPIRTTLKYLNDTKTLIAFSQDATKEKELENLKYQFISIVNHELRTPLTSISGSLKIILSELVGEIPAPMKEMVNVADHNTTRLLEVINDLVNVEHLKSKYELNFTTEFLKIGNLVAKP